MTQYRHGSTSIYPLPFRAVDPKALTHDFNSSDKYNRHETDNPQKQNTSDNKRLQSNTLPGIEVLQVISVKMQKVDKTPEKELLKEDG